MYQKKLNLIVLFLLTQTSKISKANTHIQEMSICHFVLNIPFACGLTLMEYVLPWDTGYISKSSTIICKGSEGWALLSLTGNSGPSQIWKRKLKRPVWYTHITTDWHINIYCSSTTNLRGNTPIGKCEWQTSIVKNIDSILSLRIIQGSGIPHYKSWHKFAVAMRSIRKCSNILNL